MTTSVLGAAVLGALAPCAEAKVQKFVLACGSAAGVPLKASKVSRTRFMVAAKPNNRDTGARGTVKGAPPRFTGKIKRPPAQLSGTRALPLDATLPPALGSLSSAELSEIHAYRAVTSPTLDARDELGKALAPLGAAASAIQSDTSLDPTSRQALLDRIQSVTAEVNDLIQTLATLSETDAQARIIAAFADTSGAFAAVRDVLLPGTCS